MQHSLVVGGSRGGSKVARCRRCSGVGGGPMSEVARRGFGATTAVFMVFPLCCVGAKSKKRLIFNSDQPSVVVRIKMLLVC